MAKLEKKKRMQAVATSVPKHAGAKENVKAKAKGQAKEKAKDFRKGKAFDKAQGIAPENTPASDNFDVVLGLIQAARARAVTAVNTTLIELYSSIGQYISRKAAKDGWGTGTVAELSRTIQRKYPGMMGYSASNLWRMTQFYDMYCEQPKLAPLVRVLSWTHNLIILSRCKGKEEREFYLRLTVREKWVKRDLERQITGALFERTVLAPPKMSAALAGAHPEAAAMFKDSYLVEFLELPRDHSEPDLQRGLLEKLKRFLIELGRDFSFVGSQYPLQVGGRDFALDLLFFNRALNCLVAIELKIGEFEPEHLGKMEFYLEALDQFVKKPHENPSIGVLLCATKDRKVVEFSLRRAMSPALVAQYQTSLPDKQLLQDKLNEFFELEEQQSEMDHTASRVV